MSFKLKTNNVENINHHHLNLKIYIYRITWFLAYDIEFYFSVPLSFCTRAVDLWSWTIRVIFQWIMKKPVHYQAMKVCKCVRPQLFKDQAYQRQQKNYCSIHRAQSTEAQHRTLCSFNHSFIWAKVCPIWIWMHHKQQIIRCLYLEHHPAIRICYRRVSAEFLIHHHRQQGKFPIWIDLFANSNFLLLPSEISEFIRFQLKSML